MTWTVRTARQREAARKMGRPDRVRGRGTAVNRRNATLTIVIAALALAVDRDVSDAGPRADPLARGSVRAAAPSQGSANSDGTPADVIQTSDDFRSYFRRRGEEGPTRPAAAPEAARALRPRPRPRSRIDLHLERNRGEMRSRSSKPASVIEEGVTIGGKLVSRITSRRSTITTPSATSANWRDGASRSPNSTSEACMRW